MIEILKDIYLHKRTYFLGIGVITIFILGFFFPTFFILGKLFLFLLLGVILVDALLLWSIKNGVNASRMCGDRFSNGDQNSIQINVINRYNFNINIDIIDEIPFQFQVRDFLIQKKIDSHKSIDLKYYLRPTHRGLYSFGKLLVYVYSPIGLVGRRYSFEEGKKVAVYPSYIQLKKYDLKAISNQLVHYGFKKIRKLGHTLEFEKIKEYVMGDDYRTINWKATAKSQKLMVNQYQDEKSQPVYCLIDTGRIMKMPFDGLSLLDYAINATLVLSNVILLKQDKVGMLTFSKKISNRVVAEKKGDQMQKIMENLYQIETNFLESDFGRLYIDIKQNITHRSFLLLFTNFETLDSLRRQMKYLKAIAKSHLLVVVFFENTELNTLTSIKAENTQDIYNQVIANKFMFEKKLIVQELKSIGIQTILTSPEKLTIESINKYIEVKQRGIL